jgi:hypothetical protein
VRLAVLALRTLVLAYGHDGGALHAPGQRNRRALDALMHAAAYVLLRPREVREGKFEPSRELRWVVLL